MATIRALHRSSPALVVGLAAAGVMALAQAPIPFVDDDRLLTTVVVVAFFTATCALAADVWPPRRVAVAAGVVVVGTLALEWVGHSTGWPFGAYDYTDALAPQIAGVPVIVPLAWLAMAIPAREVAARVVGPGWARVAVGALALTAWDLMLDPQMVEAGYWVWEAEGPWRGIPLSNYAGWLVSSLVVMVVLDRIVPHCAGSAGASRLLLALYTWWGFSEALAFLVFFGDPVVGLVGGAVMLTLASLAWR
ncbi:MAG TPA: carotenoid biosynthesis protein, partial [Acidimicrobiales bacterium]|nr:carotenoid biosynthesis protein [Acidimicrobiales bacterium]